MGKEINGGKEEVNWKTKRALKKTINNWEKAIKKGIGVDLGLANAPLCKLFISCKYGCPVFKKTLKMNCADSPFEELINHILKRHITLHLRIYCSECKELAKKHLDFLRGLLDEKTS
ncbi:MAG: hypothetical protein J7L26_12670 [Candidatus Aminicenantes bacterium]|nr:hypothetical protein [Candidatus Aminicenantes bacterium]